jgi:PTH1 family peptidyl-tRNA hydrolase
VASAEPSARGDGGGSGERSSAPWLVIGLGNPGGDYANTRHNAGAMAVGMLAERSGEKLKRSRQRADVAETRDGQTRVILARPHGYMNDSGGPVSTLARYYKVPLDRLIVVYDDIDLAAGKVQVRKGGGTAGHNGMKDIVKALGGPDFFRVRLGVGRPPGRQDPADYVLEAIPKRLAEDFGVLVERGADAAIDLTRLPLERVQDRHNH